MSRAVKRETPATTSDPSLSGPSTGSTADPRPRDQGQRASARPEPAFQPIQPNQQTRSPQMAVQPPLLPAIPPSHAHHHSGISLDSTSSRTSFPSPLQSSLQLNESPTKENSAAWLSRRDSTQRRAFRQRRKDPSCDACRERKVKCDATASGNCSECAARGIRCQFTKDSNRRMSSIKQVQELQKQIGQMRKENDRLKLMLTPGDTMDLDSPSEPSPGTGYHTRQRSGRSQLYTNTCRNINRYASGIFRAPPTHRLRRSPPSVNLDKHLFLSEKRAFELLEACHNTFVQDLPVIDWESLVNNLRSLYSSAGMKDVQMSWLALNYAIFALGSLQIKDSNTNEASQHLDGPSLIRSAVQHLDLSAGDIGLDHCRAALIVSIYYMEADQRSTAWLWLSLAVSLAFEMGLNEEAPLTVSVTDAEARRKVWWTIYLWERLLSVELSRPMLIDDEDIRVVLPTATESMSDRSHPTAVVVTTTPLMRLYGSLRQILRASDVPGANLMTFESLLEPVAQSYPAPVPQPTPADYDTHFFYFSTLLSNAKLILHRQNLAPSKPLEERLGALENCAAAAQSTSRCIEDSMQKAGQSLELSAFSADEEDNSKWAEWIRSSASSLLCTHLWRCVLVLSFSQDFKSAWACAKVCKAIGALRKINVACGRQLIFFLGRMTRTPGLGDARTQALAQDVEMLAYVTGDMQGDSRRAWVWNESDLTSQLLQQELDAPGQQSEASSLAETTIESRVWVEVEALLHQLEEERTQQRPLPDIEGETRLSRAQSSTDPQGGPSAARGRRRNSNSRKRMSIANII